MHTSAFTVSKIKTDKGIKKPKKPSIIPLEINQTIYIQNFKSFQ